MDAIERLKSAAKLRDPVLAFGGFVYLLGYGCWLLHSWDLELGAIPALQGQYFISGIIPALLAAALWGGSQAIAPFRSTISQRSGSRRSLSWSPRALTGAAILIVALSFIAPFLAWLGPLVLYAQAALSSDPRQLARFSRLTGIWALSGSALLGITLDSFFPSLFWLGLTSLLFDSLFSVERMSTSAGIVLAVTAFYSYQAFVFPVVAPELGGPAARCVSLDLDHSVLSNDTSRLTTKSEAGLYLSDETARKLRSLLEPEGTAAGGSQHIRRTPPVWLFPRTDSELVIAILARNVAGVGAVPLDDFTFVRLSLETVRAVIPTKGGCRNYQRFPTIVARWQTLQVKALQWREMGLTLIKAYWLEFAMTPIENIR